VYINFERYRTSLLGMKSVIVQFVLLYSLY